MRKNVNINAGSQSVFLMCKAVVFLITVMFALASPGWSGCDLQGSLAERDIITLGINAPSKSLVEISANDIRVIVEDPNELTPSGQYGALTEVYGLSGEGRPILKKIVTAPVGDDIKALQSALSNSADSIVLTQKNGYFLPHSEMKNLQQCLMAALNANKRIMASHENLSNSEKENKK